MALEVDFSNVPRDEKRGGDDFEPLPDGWFNVRIERAEETMAKTGSVGVKLGLVVDDGPHKGRWMWDRIWFTPNSMAYSRDKLEAIGFPVPEGKFTLNPQQLVGYRFAVRTQQETFEGKAEAKVKAYDQRSGADMPHTPVEEDWRSQLPEGEEAPF